MKRFVLQELVKPLARRLGTAAAGGVIAIGATQPLADQVEVVIVAVCGLGLDLLLSHLDRK